MSVEPYREKLLKTILDLIEDKGVTQFYSGFRGDFDAFCSSLIFELKWRMEKLFKRNIKTFANAVKCTDFN